MTMKRASCCKTRQGGQPVEPNIGAPTKIVSKVCSRNDFEVKGQYGNVMIIKKLHAFAILYIEANQ